MDRISWKKEEKKSTKYLFHSLYEVEGFIPIFETANNRDTFGRSQETSNIYATSLISLYIFLGSLQLADMLDN